jgi:hypothetical protein
MGCLFDAGWAKLNFSKSLSEAALQACHLSDMRDALK